MDLPGLIKKRNGLRIGVSNRVDERGSVGAGCEKEAGGRLGDWRGSEDLIRSEFGLSRVARTPTPPAWHHC